MLITHLTSSHHHIGWVLSSQAGFRAVPTNPMDGRNLEISGMSHNLLAFVSVHPLVSILYFMCLCGQISVVNLDTKYVVFLFFFVLV